MSTPKQSGADINGTTYSSQGHVPQGYMFKKIILSSPGWSFTYSSGIIRGTITVTNNVLPTAPVVKAEVQEMEVRPYAIKIKSNNDILVPVYNASNNQYDDVDLTSLVAQLVAQI
jgi:hypothetical protein